MQARPLAPEPKAKPPPTAAALRAFLEGAPALHFRYQSSPSGVDSNLLLLLHGLGDTAASFAALGASLQRSLPQTAVMAVQAPLRVPLLEEEAYMWWNSFDPLGERMYMGWAR